MSFNNNQNQKPINNGSNKKNSINFNNVIKNLSASPNAKPWYKKKASIIAMSSTLGVGLLATVIAVPIVVLTSQSNSVIPPDPITIEEFNLKSVPDKIISYNSIVTNSTNKTAIQRYFLDSKITGFRNFFLTNIDGTSTVTNTTNYNLFKTFLDTATSSTDSNPFIETLNYSSTNEMSILNMMGGGTSSATNENLYFTSIFSTPNNIATMYSPLVDNIVGLTIESDFSIKISFKASIPVGQAYAFNVVVTNTNNVPATATFHLSYKQDIVLNNTTLFPGMQDYVKRSILHMVN